MWTAVQQSNPFLREPPQGDLHLFGLSAGALPALWAQRLYEANGGTLAEVTLMGAVTDPEIFVEESLGKVGRYYHVYDAFAFEAWINTSGGAVSARSVFKDPSSIASLFDMVGWCPKAPIIFHHFEEDTEVSLASVIAAQAALNTCFGSGSATLVTYDSTVVPRLAYPGAEHLELWDNLLPAYADGTLTGLTW